MIKHPAIAAMVTLACANPCLAQGYDIPIADWTAAAGNQQGIQFAANFNGNATADNAAVPALAAQPYRYVPPMRNGLPPCNMDSFVYEAKEYADLIYGDEGIDGPPPYFGFTKPHRINSGLLDTRDAGITTGHGSLLPDGVGRDEFIGAEYTMSGPRGASSGGFVPSGFGPPDYSGANNDPQSPNGGWPGGGGGTGGGDALKSSM